MARRSAGTVTRPKGIPMLRLLPIAALSIATPAIAGDPIAPEHRLTPAEVEQALTAAADKRIAQERATGVAPVDVLDPIRGLKDGSPLDLSGSVGFSVGTHGYRSAYGSAVVGLGGTSSVAFSIERTEGDRQRMRWMNP